MWKLILIILLILIALIIAIKMEKIHVIGKGEISETSVTSEQNGETSVTSEISETNEQMSSTHKPCAEIPDKFDKSTGSPELSNFLTYLSARFGIKAAEYVKPGEDDATIFSKMRADVKDAYGQSVARYNKAHINKAKGIKRDIPYAKSILDVGTEKIEFLDALSQVFKTKKVRGINIGDGFCHYEEAFGKQNDPRFQLYDGKTIPYPDRHFELVTVFSVVHHIPDDVYENFFKEITRVSSKYIFIKDVDLISENPRRMFQLQHDTFEGGIVEGNKSFLNCGVTLGRAVRELRKNGFIPMNTIKVTDNFNRTYYAAFKRGELLSPSKPLLA